MMLPDGTVVPHYLGLQRRGVAEDTGSFTNVALRIGEVKGVVEPTADESLTGKYFEYTVEVQHRDGSGPGTSTLYTNCLLSSLFGSGGDQERFTLRADDKDDQNRKDDGVGVGAKVLLLCVNGEGTRTWIIGGVRDPETDETKDTKDDGHNWYREFNGVRQTINKDGEYTLLFRGATARDGKLADGVKEENGNAKLFFDKDGGITLSDGDKGKEKLVFSKKDKKTTLESGGTMAMKAPDGVTIDTDKNTVITADKTYIGSKNAAENLVLGKTYREAEGKCNDSLAEKFSSLGQNITSLSTSLTSAATALTTAGSLMSTPIYGAVAAGPNITQAAMQLTSMVSTLSQMSQTLSQMQSAIKDFEGQKKSYISDHNFTQS